MKILSIEKMIFDDQLSVWVEDGKFYKAVVVHLDGQIDEKHALPTKQYKGYDHFTATMGKFDPYTAFRKAPVDVAKLDFEDLTKMRHEFEKEVRDEAAQKEGE